MKIKTWQEAVERNLPAVLIRSADAARSWATVTAVAVKKIESRRTFWQKVTGTYDEKRLLRSRLKGEITRKTLQVKAKPIMKHLEATQSRPASPNDFIITVLWSIIWSWNKSNCRTNRNLHPVTTYSAQTGVFFGLVSSPADLPSHPVFNVDCPPGVQPVLCTVTPPRGSYRVPAGQSG